MLKTPFGRLAGVLKLPHLGLVEEWEARQRQQKKDLHFRKMPEKSGFRKLRLLMSNYRSPPFRRNSKLHPYQKPRATYRSNGLPASAPTSNPKRDSSRFWRL